MREGIRAEANTLAKASDAIYGWDPNQIGQACVNFAPWKPEWERQALVPPLETLHLPADLWGVPTSLSLALTRSKDAPGSVGSSPLAHGVWRNKKDHKRESIHLPAKGSQGLPCDDSMEFGSVRGAELRAGAGRAVADLRTAEGTARRGTGVGLRGAREPKALISSGVGCRHCFFWLCEKAIAARHTLGCKDTCRIRSASLKNRTPVQVHKNEVKRGSFFLLVAAACSTREVPAAMPSILDMEMC